MTTKTTASGRNSAMTPRFPHTLPLVAILFASGCASTSTEASFSSPQAASTAFVDALRADDLDRVEEILGSEGRELLTSGDEVADRSDREDFVAAWDEKHDVLVTGGEATLLVGPGAWPFPIPLVQSGGEWTFDVERGKDEVLSRRIGRNELATIEVCRAIVDAQREYAEIDHGNGKAVYAARFRSSSGKQDGLYWPAKEGQDDSPLGPLVAAATAEGYEPRKADEGTDDPASTRQPYHGYYFRILSAQGDSAPGGAMSYVADGRMTRGFALIAVPATYGNSGIMTFLTDASGIVYQRDLGPDTEKIAAKITAFDPTSEWVLVSD
jgi:hypothetical protein